MTRESSQLEGLPTKTWSVDSPDLPQVVDRMSGRICPAGFGPELRAEVAQETWARLAKRGDLPDGSKRELNSSFLFTTVTNVCREKKRVAAKLKERELSIDGEDPDGLHEVAHSSAPDPERLAVSRALGRAIHECLARLKRDRRRAVVLHLMGFKIPEIAHRLRWTLKSAEGRAYRGLRQLQACLAHKGVAP